MIISDLQYIESAENSEIQGGGKWGYANANADGNAQAYGDKTNAYTNTYVVADANAGFSGAGSKSSAQAENYYGGCDDPCKPKDPCKPVC